MSAPRTSTMTLPLTAYLDGIGLLGPGLADWPSAEPILAGATPYVPAQKQIFIKGC